MKFKITRITIICMIGICLFYYFISHYDGQEYPVERAEDYVRRVCEMGNVPGMSVAVLDQGQEYYINVGYADKEEKIDMTSEIRCELGSTTKAFTALGVLMWSRTVSWIGRIPFRNIYHGFFRHMQGKRQILQ